MSTREYQPLVQQQAPLDAEVERAHQEERALDAKLAQVRRETQRLRSLQHNSSSATQQPKHNVIMPAALQYAPIPGSEGGSDNTALGGAERADFAAGAGAPLKETDCQSVEDGDDGAAPVNAAADAQQQKQQHEAKQRSPAQILPTGPGPLAAEGQAALPPGGLGAEAQEQRPAVTMAKRPVASFLSGHTDRVKACHAFEVFEAEYQRLVCGCDPSLVPARSQQEAAAAQSPDRAQAARLAELRAELCLLKPRALSARAKEMGVDEESVDAAMDVDDITGTLIEMILKRIATKPLFQMVLSCADDWTLRLWDMESGRCVRVMGPEMDVALSADEVDVEKLIKQLEEELKQPSQSPEKTLAKETFEKARELKAQTTRQEEPLQRDFLGSRNMERVLNAEQILSDLKKAKAQFYNMHENWIRDCFAFQVKQTSKWKALSASSDKMLKVWDLETGKCEFTLQDKETATDGRTFSHKDWVMSCEAFLFEGTWHALSCSSDRTLKLWYLDGRETPLRKTICDLGYPQEIEQNVKACCVFQSGDTTGIGTITIEDAGFDFDDGTYSGVSCLTDGSGTGATFDVVVNDGKIQSVSVVNQGTGYAVGDEITFDNIGEGEGQTLTITQSLYALSCGRDYTVKVWNLGECLNFDNEVVPTVTLRGHNDWVSSCCVYQTKEATWALSSSDDHTLKLWDLANMPQSQSQEERWCIATMIGHTDLITQCRMFERNGQVFALSASADTTTRLWDLGKCTGDSYSTRGPFGSCVRALSCEQPVRGCAIRADYALSCSADHHIYVWNLSKLLPRHNKGETGQRSGPGRDETEAFECGCQGQIVYVDASNRTKVLRWGVRPALLMTIHELGQHTDVKHMRKLQKEGEITSCCAFKSVKGVWHAVTFEQEQRSGRWENLRVVLWNLDDATDPVGSINNVELNQYKYTRISGSSAHAYMDCDEERVNLVVCGGCAIDVLTIGVLKGDPPQGALVRLPTTARPLKVLDRPSSGSALTPQSTGRLSDRASSEIMSPQSPRTSSKSRLRSTSDAFLGCGIFTYRHPEEPIGAGIIPHHKRYCAWSQEKHSTVSSTKYIFRLWVSTELSGSGAGIGNATHKLFAKQRVDGSIRGCCLFANNDSTPMAITFGDDWCLRLWDLSKCDEQEAIDYLGESVYVTHPLVVMIGHTKPVVGCCISHDQVNGHTWAISVSDDETARIWDLRSGDATQFDQSGEIIMHCARKQVCKHRDGYKCSDSVCVSSVQPSFRHGRVPVLVQDRLLDFSWVFHSILLDRVLDDIEECLQSMRSDLNTKVKFRFRSTIDAAPQHKASGGNDGVGFRDFLLVQAMSCAENIVDTIHSRLPDSLAATTRLNTILARLTTSDGTVENSTKNLETKRAKYTIQILTALARQTEVCQADGIKASSNDASVFSWASVLILLGVRKRKARSVQAELKQRERLRGEEKERGFDMSNAYSTREHVIHFGKPIRFLEHSEVQTKLSDQCVQPVTSPPMKKAGASEYCWVIPESDSDFKLGGFAYRFGEGKTSKDIVFFPCVAADAITAGYEAPKSFPEELAPLRIVQTNLHEYIQVSQVEGEGGTWNMRTKAGDLLRGQISQVYGITLDKVDRHLAYIPQEATHFVWAYRSDTQTMSGDAFQDCGGFVYGNDGMTKILAVNALGLSTTSPSVLASAVRNASWIGHLLHAGPQCIDIEMAFDDRGYKHELIRRYLDAMTVLQSNLDGHKLQRCTMEKNKLDILLPAGGLVHLLGEFPDLMRQYVQHLPLCNIRQHNVGSAWSREVYDDPHNPDNNPDRISVSASNQFWGVSTDGRNGWKYVVDGQLDRRHISEGNPLGENLVVSSCEQHFVVPLTGVMRDASSEGARTLCTDDPFIDLLDAIVTLAKDDPDIFQHPRIFRGEAVQAIVKYKWESGGRVKYYRLMMAYALHFICFMCLALAKEDDINLMTRGQHTRRLRSLYWIMWGFCLLCWALCCAVCLLMQIRTCKRNRIRTCLRTCLSEARKVKLGTISSVCSVQIITDIDRLLFLSIRFVKNLLSPMWILLLLTPFALLTMHTDEDNGRMHAVDTLQAVTLMCMALNSAYFLRGWDTTAFLMSMLRKVLTDMIPFTVVLMMLLGLFTSVFFLLLRDSDVGYEWDMGEAPQFHSLYDAAVSTTNMALGDVDVEYFRHAPFVTLATGVYLVFMFIVPVVMLNSLIAIMGNSFEQVKEERQERRVFERAQLILELYKIPELRCRSSDAVDDFVHVLTGDTSTKCIQLRLAYKEQEPLENISKRVESIENLLRSKH